MLLALLFPLAPFFFSFFVRDKSLWLLFFLVFSNGR